MNQAIVNIEERLDAVTTKATENTDGIEAVNVRVDGVQEDIVKLKDEIYQKLRSVDSNCKAAIANRPSGSGCFKLYGRGPRDLSNRAEGEFYLLVSQATAKRHVFVVGHAMDAAGNPVHTILTVKEVLLKYFSTVDYELLTTNPNSVTSVRRFRVHPAHPSVTKQIARDINSELCSKGWWIQQETPNKLRKINGVATKFFMEAKKTEPTLRRYTFEVDCGYITIDGTSILPVFMIPEDIQKWAGLAKLLAESVKVLLDLPWLQQMANPVKIDFDVLKKWGQIIGHKPTRALYNSVIGLSEPQNLVDDSVNENRPVTNLQEPRLDQDRQQRTPEGVSRSDATHSTGDG